MNNTAKTQNVEQNEAPRVEKKPSRLAVMRELLAEEQGYTMQELSDLTGVKLSTVKCQIYFHLKNNGNPCERLPGSKYRLLRDDKLDAYTQNDDYEAMKDAERDIAEDTDSKL
jgi:hypothetical protein